MLWKNTQHSWAGGQLDAELMGRQDLEKYFTGACEIENMSLRRQGNLNKRRGTDYIASLSDLSPLGVKLIPVVIDRDTGYYVLLVLESSNLYAYLAGPAGVRAAGEDVWTRTATTSCPRELIYSGSIDPKEVNYCQIGDNIYLAHKSFAPCYLSVYPTAAIPLVKTAISFNTTGLSSPTIGTIDTSNMYKTSCVCSIQSNGSYEEKNITTTSYSVANKKKTIHAHLYRKVNGVWVAIADTDEEVNVPTNTVSYVATYIKDGVESAPCAKVDMTYISPWQEGDNVKIPLSRGSNTNKPDSYNVYKRTGTDYGLIASVKANNTSTDDEYVIDDYITPDLSVQPPPSGDSFTGTGNYPSCVGQYQQRLIYAATANDPFKFWMSAVGDLYTFKAHDTIQEQDAISAELAATESPNINHIAFSRDIVMFTDGGEWRVGAVSGNAISYRTISATLQSCIGSARYVEPITVGSEIIFLERNEKTLRSIGYNFSSDGYETHDLSILAQSIFADKTIVRMCYRQYPESTILCVLDDGTMASLVYMKEHDVVAWSHITLGGEVNVIDIAANKRVVGPSSDVMLVVAGISEDTCELWGLRSEWNEDPDAGFYEYHEYCIDGASVVGPSAAKTWLTAHSEGVVVHGTTIYTYEQRESIPVGASGATMICGYLFTARLTTTYPEPRGTKTAQIEIKNARGCDVRVRNSGSFTVRAADVATARATDVTLTTWASKDCRVNLVGTNARDGRIVIESGNPYPLNILSLSTVYQIEAEDGNE